MGLFCQACETHYKIGENCKCAPEPFSVEDVIDEIRGMRQVCDEHLLGVRETLAKAV